MKMRRMQTTGKTGNVYRCFSTIAKPFVTRNNYRNVMDELSKCRTFREIAQQLRILATATSNMRNSEDADTIADANDLALFLESVNRELTARINSFLNNNLSISPTIDDFVEDVSELGMYLAKNHGSQYLTAFEQWEHAVIETVVKPIDEEIEAELSGELNNGDEQLTFTYIPVCYSITYIDVMAEELNISVNDREALLIPEGTSPTLFKIAQSIYDQLKGYQVTSAFDLIVTKDNEIFRLYKGYLIHDSYLVGR
jgi:hypothetical protein